MIDYAPSQQQPPLKPIIPYEEVFHKNSEYGEIRYFNTIEDAQDYVMKNKGWITRGIDERWVVVYVPLEGK